MVRNREKAAGRPRAGSVDWTESRSNASRFKHQPAEKTPGRATPFQAPGHPSTASANRSFRLTALFSDHREIEKTPSRASFLDFSIPRCRAAREFSRFLDSSRTLRRPRAAEKRTRKDGPSFLGQNS